jgi:U3 small nucleolar RNA-associated protein 13
MQAHFTAVTSISMAPDGWTLLSAGRDKVVVLWDLRSNTKLATLAVFEAVEGAPMPLISLVLL